jgi:hypothetical protein
MKENHSFSSLSRSYQAPRTGVINLTSGLAFLAGSRESLGDLDPTNPNWDPED